MTRTDPDIEYAFWTSPGDTFRVTYPLGLFHEIDFQVNEGYRRIPHGGVETGGLLFGHPEPGSARIEAFRNIECEHASGPSFVLSERDLAKLKEQITAAPSDPELHGLEILGWFIGHTRSSLKMNDRDCALFDELFPEPGKITLLIKPERFQPTRFGFLVRGSDRKFEKDATQRAIILPLPGRASRAGEGPVPSIPAPVGPPPTSLPPAKPQPKAARPQLSGAQFPPADTQLSEERKTLDLVPASSTLAPGPKIEEIRTQPEEGPGIEELDLLASHQKTRKLDRDKTSKLRLTFVLLVAAILGCGVGYWAYAQLPSATIALNIHIEPSSVLVSWPVEQTRDAVYAAIRVDDGQPVPLSPEEKVTGEAEITPASDNVKIELIAQHWLRDSRGIIRYVKPAPPVTAQIPDTTPSASHSPRPSEPQ